ncbi:PREDICTED: GTP-binding protein BRASSINAZOLE INSENSITIVE PALE GREEN 2, chloroplastic [Nelumbo nucifera]|uniref:GTP-binding protein BRASSINAZOLE INSENSITIVE PALE GREEN 2, chloroplastic n=1 Tax=Nelumbo nucifera TaxID=4432 RepID=A0A1U8A3W9_NELNU|nr:PREDICTED: GTP-binding protein BRASSINAZOLE INSENSITIVE PALE GREEN 2, chloroplastic [Nelumbo nucifera]XP_010256424.1 PREDICTED: GTP-binding protein BRASSINAZOLE INSENSITIVE PALE GREEN 2, chloroplastic [Nelumbo nucifera]XP_010256426.1 PREDICTED: GTP-binding protein BRASSINAZOLE INSENSITIVE PALE GREEN 2, chloroplastic [Nelumbo nucifera]XP_010256427.1 PREDICTED: GTP-binding protein BRASSINAZOLE INSENSITIVE PALE GREEN 2, chloroplastic [Nelumbo nucifera]XP_010256429.1 PREDICTED: GTP-binding prote
MLVARKLFPSKLVTRFLPLAFAASYYPPSCHHSLFGFDTTTTTTSPFYSPSNLLFTIHRSFSSESKPFPKSLRDGNYDEITSPHLLVCPGCGVYMQGDDPKLPGYFIKPSRKDTDYHSPIDRQPVAEESEISDSLKRGFLSELINPEYPTTDLNLVGKPVVCARCHSLRHYGRVKDASVENLLPDFDFDYTIGRKLVTTMGTRSVVMMVVDAADFDGSFPRKVAKLVSATIEENSAAWKQGKSGNVPRVVLVITKIDLLPPSLSPTRLEHWIRQRAREGGANKLTSVHLVSSLKNWGLKNLADDVCRLAGPRGNIWAIGAQNAGKSTLINSLGKHIGGNITHLTEAPVPGTTLGIIRVEGVLPGMAKLFDTPGLLHPHQILTRLTREEQKLVHISKELKPRTYRIKTGYSVHIAGLMRVDVEEASVDSIYLTVWASPYLPLHMGRTENASTMLEYHFGHQLQPPIGEKRVEELGKWMKREFHICGSSWDVSSVDIAAAGLGWVALGLKGEATLGVWTYDGVDVTLRNSMIPQRAQIFEVAGFTVSKIVSKADQASNKLKQSRKDKKQGDHKEAVSITMPLPVDADTNTC